MTGFIDNFNADAKAALYQIMDDATWIQQTGGVTPVKGAFSNNILTDELGNMINVEQPGARCFVDDVPGVAKNDLLDIQGDQYKIIDLVPDGDGMVDLILEKIR